jgi:adenosylhomocysteine nucleosidase
MKLGLMGAMPEEVDGIRAAIEVTGSERIAGRDYILGRWHGIDVVLVFSRCGKVSSASSATILLQHFGVDGIVFIGVAGAVSPSLRIGDVVIANDLVQHDMDASALPMFQRFEIPLLGKSRFPAPPAWVSRAVAITEAYLLDDFSSDVNADIRAEFHLDGPKVYSGLVASGDQFVTEAAHISDLRTALPDLLCVEMEGAAVAQVCDEHEHPLLVVRIISDLADHSAAIDFPKFLRSVATTMGTHIAERIARALGDVQLR